MTDKLEELRKIVNTMRPPYISEDEKEHYSGTFYYPDFSNHLLYSAFKEILKILTDNKPNPTITDTINKNIEHNLNTET